MRVHPTTPGDRRGAGSSRLEPRDGRDGSRRKSRDGRTAMAGSNLGAEERMRAHERVGPQRGRLRDATAGFRAAVEAPSIDGAEGDHDWCTEVAKSLAELQDAWLAHVRFTEDEDGLFQE